MRPNLKEWTAIGLLAFGIILAFVALLMPPPGEIHDSVLYIFAQILIYCGSIFGIDSYIRTLLDSHKGRAGVRTSEIIIVITDHS